MTTNQSKINHDQVLVISSEKMGHDDGELGVILIRNFLHTLKEAESIPEKIILYNAGVKLIDKKSVVLNDLIILQKAGVKILACGTCLGYFDLIETIAVGEISNMYDITNTLLQAQRVINI